MKGHPLLIRWPFVLLAAQVSRARRAEGACAVASRSASLTLDTAVPSWEVDSYEEDGGGAGDWGRMQCVADWQQA